jgi:hypothetical protein
VIFLNSHALTAGTGCSGWISLLGVLMLRLHIIYVSGVGTYFISRSRKDRTFRNGGGMYDSLLSEEFEIPEKQREKGG